MAMAPPSRDPRPSRCPHGTRVEEFQARGTRMGLVCRGRRLTAAPDVRVEVLPRSTRGLRARTLRALRALEASAVDVIVVEGMEEQGLGVAVMDRLRRAANRVVPAAAANQ